jgi:predicted homoserine dehydrogenase-like protein
MTVLDAPALDQGALRRLARRADDRGACRVALVGAGFVGRGLAHRLRRLPGVELVAVVSRTAANGVDALRVAGFAPESIAAVTSAGDVRRAVERRAIVVTAEPRHLDELEPDVVIEATGAIDAGVEVMVSALAASRDVISMNAEVDAVVGHLLHEVGRRSGSIYTIADGDQPGVLLRLLESARAMGFVPEVALNCKRHLDVHQTPGDGAGYADRDATSLLMTTAFGDGTKMQVENAVVANLTGLVPDQRGMHGIRTTLADAADDVMHVVPGGGAVDFTLGGDFGAGVAVVARPDDPDFAAPYLRYFKMGDGPHYLLFRPYHLVHLEIAATLSDVVVDRTGLASPTGPPLTEVVAMAKQTLAPGQRIDGIGGWCCYGLIDDVGDAAGLLPIGLAHHATVTRPVAADEPVPLDAVELDETAPIVRRRAQQDALGEGL